MSDATPSDATSDSPANGVLSERRHLMNLAFRMLGTVTDAEDAVQETYTRWYRMSEAERESIEVPRAWLTRAAGRVCLDVLDSARIRRERYVGQWLPEPIPAHAFPSQTESSSGVDPLDRVTLDDSIGTALLLVLEAMTPAERVAFVLHDVFRMPFDEIAAVVGRTAAACRQLATSARRRIDETRRSSATREQHDSVVRAFAAAVDSGDLATLVGVLDPNVVLRSDGGGIINAARNPVVGADRVARFLFGIISKSGTAQTIEQETNDGLAFTIWDEGRISGVVNIGVVNEAGADAGHAGGVVSDIWIVLNPDKLSLWS